MPFAGLLFAGMTAASLASAPTTTLVKRTTESKDATILAALKKNTATDWRDQTTPWDVDLFVGKKAGYADFTMYNSVVRDDYYEIRVTTKSLFDDSLNSGKNFQEVAFSDEVKDKNVVTAYVDMSGTEGASPAGLITAFLVVG